ncbi:hypothetical protein PCL_01534 [Purpureocillium lilacinum]|uniref:Uncharacterized protein n=1 Tax=Purpureocillium lilacinum TaxID=33203 RepID=A0A2U3E3T6_PURLI|nr:hypothetical protein PCL_01534 [Purpureocillium lilacinum]
MGGASGVHGVPTPPQAPLGATEASGAPSLRRGTRTQAASKGASITSHSQDRRQAAPTAPQSTLCLRVQQPANQGARHNSDGARRVGLRREDDPELGYPCRLRRDGHGRVRGLSLLGWDFFSSLSSSSRCLLPFPFTLHGADQPLRRQWRRGRKGARALPTWRPRCFRSSMKGYRGLSNTTAGGMDRRMVEPWFKRESGHGIAEFDVVLRRHHLPGRTAPVPVKVVGSEQEPQRGARSGAEAGTGHGFSALGKGRSTARSSRAHSQPPVHWILRTLLYRLAWHSSLLPPLSVRRKSTRRRDRSSFDPGPVSTRELQSSPLLRLSPLRAAVPPSIHSQATSNATAHTRGTSTASLFGCPWLSRPTVRHSQVPAPACLPVYLRSNRCRPWLVLKQKRRTGRAETNLASTPSQGRRLAVPLRLSQRHPLAVIRHKSNSRANTTRIPLPMPSTCSS